MSPFEYQQACLKNDLKDYVTLYDELLPNTSKLRLVHMALGLTGEAGEVADIIKKNFIYDKPLDRSKVLEEAGDCLWYMSNLLHELGFTIEDAMKANFAKLAKRYPEGFNKQAAIARADKA